jgi:hypothetical protein
MFSTKTKVRVGGKVAKQAAKHPKLAMRGARAASPVVKHAAKSTARAQGRKARRTVPRVAVGALVGAAAMYFLDPANGGKRRRKVAGLLGSGSDQPADAGVQAGGPAHPAPGHVPPTPAGT